MMEKRNIIAYQQIVPNDDYAFPYVCAWVRDGDVVTTNVYPEFLTQGRDEG
jgi:hypothetical protein